MASVSPEASHITERFRDCLRDLPADVRRLARAKHRLWLSDTTARSLEFKKRQGQNADIWQAYVGDDHRALCVRDGNEYTWFWIGTKQDALKLRGV